MVITEVRVTGIMMMWARARRFNGLFAGLLADTRRTTPLALAVQNRDFCQCRGRSSHA